MTKPPLPYGRQLIEDDDVEAVVAALRSDWLTQGPRVGELEQSLARACGARHAVVVSNGTVALHLACLAAGIGPGDEGITTPITFAASANCLRYCGAIPRFADIRADTWNLDPDGVDRAIGPRTKALIPVHFAGLPCDMDEICALAARRGLVVIADACHALGATYHGQPIAAAGPAHLTCLSFHPVKHITTGEGGAILCDDDQLAARLRRLRHHGISNDPGEIAQGHGGWYYEMQLLGTNARLPDILCALGESQLRKLDRFVARRQAIANGYRSALAGIPGIRMQHTPEDRSHSYHLFVVWLDPDHYQRRTVYDELRRRGIYSQVHYVPCHLHPYYRRLLGTEPGQFPRAERYYEGALSLPMFPSMTDEDVTRVTTELGSVLSAIRGSS
ncbi:MAG: UDP-4-amino-4,6-dideoxy-N-acetyl-beta-L-altrosamine transaminase [Pseudomonadota bacterium]